MKTKSIKSKIMYAFSVVFLLMLVALILVNHFYMDDFYTLANKRKMMEIAVEFENLSKEANRQRAFNAVRNSGSLLALYDKSNNLLPGSHNDQVVINYLDMHMDDLKEKAKKSGGIYFGVIRGEENDGFLVLVKMLDEGNTLLLSKKMALAREVSLLNFRFMLITSVFVYAIALIGIFIVSSKFSRPIINIMNKAEKMSRLDFSKKIELRSTDEIGLLSQSINKLSDELSNTIMQLDESNKKLNLELEKEKKLEKMRRRFVSDVSHELKNPLSMIQGYADGLKHNIPKSEKDKAYYYQVIVDESLKMNTLIKDLLDLSSYESGSFTLNKEMVDLAQIVKDYVKKQSGQIQNKGLTVEIQESEQSLVFGDGLRLGQIVANLLNNALKYVDEQGAIIIKLNQVKGKISLTMANTGPLIPEKELEEIWNSFYQIDNTKKGNGLGLAIVKSIVNLHEGSYRAYIEGSLNCFEIII